MKVYMTEIEAINQETKQLEKFNGIKVQANSVEEAQRLLKTNNLNYHTIVGEVIEIVRPLDELPITEKASFNFSPPKLNITR